MTGNVESPVEIRKGSVEDCILVSESIPEFSDRKYDRAEYLSRLKDRPHLILVAFSGSTPVGFKAGYERDGDGSFYSWMGGIMPAFRGMNIAVRLAKEQEIWAKKQGYTSIVFKTRNYLKSMLIFALKNGFNIIGILETDYPENHRIILKKIL